MGDAWPRVELPAPWPESVEGTQEVEELLRARLVLDVVGPAEVGTVVGLDAAYDTRSELTAAAVVVLDARSLEVVASSTAVGRAGFPYLPGLLAFREVPLLARAWNGVELGERPGLLVCDGYGLAHPRRFGLACHVGALTGLPTVGVAKSAFVGIYEPPGRERGASSPLLHEGEVVGRALRTQDGVREVFVSVGNAIDLDSACRLVLAATPRYRLPETTRAADQASRRVLAAALEGA